MPDDAPGSRSGIDGVVRAGTRASRLARWQTEHVIARLSQTWPALSFERVEVRTLGDRLSDVPLPRIGDRGLFTRELEDGLRGGTIDFAVHSLKDLPTEAPEGLALGAVLARDDPRDVLVSREGRRLADLPPGARLGTSSLRRRAQVMALRRDLAITDIRGNVPTRVEKVQRGEYDATLLAMAGLRRLDMTGVVAEVLADDMMVPAPGQGALAIQVRATDDRLRRVVAAIDDAGARLATAAERRVLSALEGGCQAPIGALATWNAAGRLQLVGIVAAVDGTHVLRATDERAVADERDALALGDLVAAALARQGARAVIAQARQLAAAGDPA
jgi:hydroxymethylbilane synthase